MAKKNPFFRIATEGATTDGRVISSTWIKQMAANYDPAKYGARINLEHIRGTLPDGPFKSYGDVLALKAETIDGKAALFAQIDPTDELIELAKSRQKIYTSMEVQPNFAQTGEAYLVGLAITDSPAALGTEMLKFSAQALQNPLATRKQAPGNVFSEAVEMSLDMTTLNNIAHQIENESATLLKRAIECLAKFSDKPNTENQRDKNKNGEISNAMLYQAVDSLTKNLRTMQAQFHSLSILAQTISTLKDAQAQDHAALTDISSRLKNTDASGFTRPIATGCQSGGAYITDC